MAYRRNIDVGLFLLRIVLGVIFILHGAQKLNLIPGGHGGPSGVIAMVSGMGMKPAALWGWLLITAEFAGGIGLVLGFLTPLCALGIIISQGVAIWKVHGPHGFFLGGSGGPIPGYEYNVALIGMAVCLLVAGAGVISLDHALFHRRRTVVVRDEPIAQ